jgi:hypothetical protein
MEESKYTQAKSRASAIRKQEKSIETDNWTKPLIEFKLQSDPCVQGDLRSICKRGMKRMVPDN